MTEHLYITYSSRHYLLPTLTRFIHYLLTRLAFTIVARIVALVSTRQVFFALLRTNRYLGSTFHGGWDDLITTRTPQCLVDLYRALSTFPSVTPPRTRVNPAFQQLSAVFEASVLETVVPFDTTLQVAPVHFTVLLCLANLLTQIIFEVYAYTILQR